MHKKTMVGVTALSDSRIWFIELITMDNYNNFPLIGQWLPRQNKHKKIIMKDCRRSIKKTAINTANLENTVLHLRVKTTV